MVNPTHLADRILVHSEEKGVSLVLPWDIDSVVSLRGSFRTQPDFDGGEEVIQDILVGMLDKGTQKRSKIEISALLEDCGASIHFSSSGLAIRFDVRCLKADLKTVLGLLNNQLRYPAFDEREFNLLKDRFVANIRRMEFDTSSRASDALSRLIYTPSHPSWAIPTQDLLSKIQQTTIDDVRRYWQSMVGLNDFSVVTVGDVAGFYAQDILTMAADGLTCSPVEKKEYPLGSQKDEAVTEHIEIADRSNLDVCMGHGIPVFKRSPAYLPLYLGVFALGGNFSSHLMSSIRDRDGLTYGIRSALSGIHATYQGAWITSVTMSRDKLALGIEKTKSEIRSFIEESTPERQLNTCKTTLIGSYQIQLSTTGGLAATLLSNHEDGYPLQRIDTSPLEIQSVSVEEVNAAKAKYLAPDRLHVISAGSR